MTMTLVTQLQINLTLTRRLYVLKM